MKLHVAFLGFLLMAVVGPPREGHLRCRAAWNRGAHSCGSKPQFEFAPITGTGLSAPCAGTAITDRNGVTLSVTRATAATCLKRGYTTGIAVGDLVKLGVNTPRVVTLGTTTLKLLGEPPRTNYALRSEEFNLTWTASATVTADTTLSPEDVQNADTLSDGSGAASQGVCQAITTTSATKHSVSVFVRAGTVASATITMTGTGSATGNCSSTITTLSGTTWDRISCSSAAAYAGTLTSVTVCLNVGNNAAVTGTIIAYGYQHEVDAPYPSSYIPTTSAAVTRNADLADFTLPQAVAATGSFAITFTPLASTPWPGTCGSDCGGPAISSNAFRIIYMSAATNVTIYDNTNTASTAANLVAMTPKRYWTSWSTANGMIVRNATDGNQGTSAFNSATQGASTQLRVLGALGLNAAGFIEQLCLDTSETVCR